MARRALLFTGLLGAVMLCGCGKNNGLIAGNNNGVALLSIKISPLAPTLTLKVSPPAQFTALGTFSTGNPQDITKQVTWSAADTTVATINSSGVATAVNSGRTYIFAAMNDPVSGKRISVNTILSVVPQLTGITVAPSSATIAKGTAQQFRATGSFNDGTSADITASVSWNSSVPGTASVSSSPGIQGQVTAITPGSTNISATLGTVSSSLAALTVTGANLLGISVTPDSSTVPFSSSQQFAATGNFDDSTTQNISATVNWTSTDVTAARVTSAGMVTGLGLGSATITATSGSVSGATGVTVDASLVSGVQVLPAPTIAKGTSFQARAVAVFKDGGTLEVTATPGIEWTSGAGATVNSSGLVTGTASGSATITATLGSGGPSGNTTVQISKATPQSLVVAPAGTTVAPGTTQSLIALATLSDGTQQDVSSSSGWSSDNLASIAFPAQVLPGLQQLTIAQAGVPGVAHLTATLGTVSSSAAPLTVSNASWTALSLSPGSAAIPLVGGYQFAATGTFSDGTSQDLTLALALTPGAWSASNNAIAIPNQFGYTVSGAPGQTSVVATLGSESGAASLVVNPGAISRIDVCPASISNPLSNCPLLDPFPPPPPIAFGQGVPSGLVAIATLTDGSRQDVTSSAHWSSASPAVAIVSNDPGIPTVATGVPVQGIVTGVAAGDVNISATAGGITGTTPVTITAAAVQFVTVTPVDSSISIGLSTKMKAVATLTDSSTQDVTPYVHWQTSAPTVAVVAPGGLAYCTGSGTTTLTATMLGISGSTTLTVTP